MLELSPRELLALHLGERPEAALASLACLETGPFCPICQDALPLFVTDELAGQPVDRLYPDIACHLDICTACLHEYQTLAEWTIAALFGESDV